MWERAVARRGSVTRTNVKRNTLHITGLVLANAYKNRITNSKKPNRETAVETKVPAIEGSGEAVVWARAFDVEDC